MKLIENFKKIITTKVAILSFLALFIFGLLYHGLIISGVIDYRYAWGGRLTSVEQMYQFEAGSIVLQFIFTAIVLIKHKASSNSRIFRISRALVLVISAMFLLNTLGNVLAVSLFEKLVFTPITLWSSIATLRIAVDD